MRNSLNCVGWVEKGTLGGKLEESEDEEAGWIGPFVQDGWVQGAGMDTVQTFSECEPRFAPVHIINQIKKSGISAFLWIFGLQISKLVKFSKPYLYNHLTFECALSSTNNSHPDHIFVT